MERIPDSVLRSIFNPDDSKLRKDQLELLGMVCHVADICKKNSITWWLSSGTLLGAIRHNGFIPWDDDMDIVLPPKEYERLKKILLEENSDEFIFQCYETDSNYINRFGKYRKIKGEVSGINPVATKRYKYRGVGFDIFKLQKNSYVGAYIASKLFKLCFRFVGSFKNNKMRSIYINVSMFVFNMLSWLIYYPLLIFRKKGEYHYQAGTGWPHHVFYEKDFYPVKMHKFESHDFPVPNNYDSYLRNNFGDYMVLPDLNTLHIHCKEYRDEISPRLASLLNK